MTVITSFTVRRTGRNLRGRGGPPVSSGETTAVRPWEGAPARSPPRIASPIPSPSERIEHVPALDDDRPSTSADRRSQHSPTEWPAPHPSGSMTARVPARRRVPATTRTQACSSDGPLALGCSRRSSRCGGACSRADRGALSGGRVRGRGCRPGPATCGRHRARGTWPWRWPRRCCGRAGQEPVRRAHEARFHRTFHPLEHRRPETVHVHQHHWFGDDPSWFQVSTSANSSTVPKPPGSTRNPSEISAMRALRSCIVAVTSSRVSPRCATSAPMSCSVITPTTSPPGRQRSVRHDPHQADVTAP
jgi:hypothetical protein